MARDTRWPISVRILGLALLNLVLIAIVLLTFAQWRFGLNIESIALAPARDRVKAIGNQFARDLDRTPYASRGDLLLEYSRRYGVGVLLVSPRGESLAGPAVELPSKLRERLGMPPLYQQRRMAAGDGGPDEEFQGGSTREPWPEEIGRDDRPSRPVRPGEPGFVPLGGLAPEPFLMVTRSPWLYWVGVRMPTTGPAGERGVPGILLLRATSLLRSRIFFEWRLLLLLGAALAATALICWWPFLHRITRSIRQMDRVTERIASGRFDCAVSIRRRDELGHLAGQINIVAQRLEGFVKHQKRFLGDVAHELCSPIARIQFALGILEQRADQAQEQYLDVLRGEIQEMSNLVNELLTFSKAGMQPAEAPLRSVELGPVVRNAAAHQLPGTGKIEISIPAETTVMAYEPYLLRAVSNLLRNGLRYAGEHGPILVSAQRNAGNVLLMVTDSGPGVPEEAIEDVFEPFYRPESARRRDTGGAGLGLAIVKSCIEACRGTVTCRNRQPTGLEVTISLAAGHNAV
jgi:two-component system sensor histidine kinase CpxA